MDKKISKTTIKKIVAANKPNSATVSLKIGDEDCVDVIVYKLATYEQWFSSISSAVSMLFGSERGFTPELISYSFGHAIISAFTNISTDDHELLLELVAIPSVMEQITAQIPEYTLKNFKSDFEKCIEVFSQDRRVGDFCDDLSALVELFNKIIEQLGSEDVVTKLTSLAKE